MLSTWTVPLEKSRNRIEARDAQVFDVSDYLIESQDWKRHVNCIIRVNRQIETWHTKQKIWGLRKETSYYAASHRHTAKVFEKHIRSHWSIENRNHYVRDVTLGEDASRIRNNAGIFARLRSFTLNILRFNRVKNIKGALFENALDLKQIMTYQGIIS